MKAVIVGCGKVGAELARTLVMEGHAVSVIDNDPKAIADISEELDLMAFVGDGADIEVLKEADLAGADIFIAVSTSDEINLLTCMMARQISDCETIARVRNPLYSRETDFIREKMGLSLIINPEYLAAEEIFNLLQLPAFRRVDRLGDGSVMTCTLRVEQMPTLTGRPLSAVKAGGDDSRTLICAVRRGDEVFIPTGSFTLADGDDITVIGDGTEMGRFLKNHRIPNQPVKNVLIGGGGTITYYLTRMLQGKGTAVRILDIDQEKCLRLAEHFPEAEILMGDSTDRRFLMKQGLQQAEAFVPLTGIDEENIVISTFARRVSDAKIITKVSRTDMKELTDTLNVDSVVYPQLMCADIISSYVRARSAGAGGNVAALFRYPDSRVEILEFTAEQEPSVCGRPLRELKLRPDTILACIIRDGVCSIPNGMSVIEAGDRVIAATVHGGMERLREILE